MIRKVEVLANGESTDLVAGCAGVNDIRPVCIEHS